jgi:3-methyladenine DNA glycosylase/8-oxoguanine DNA glycosylase
MPVARRFGSVAESIAYQQLHGKAAASIWGRVLRLVGDPVTPDGVLAVSVGELRGCGLSGSKVVSLMELSEATLAGTVPFQRFGRMDDAAVIAALSSVRGIGPWTAQMFLMFSLARLDVWPTGDFGVASGFAAAWGLPERPTPKQLADLGAPFAGVRSLVAWYCWRATETA